MFDLNGALQRFAGKIALENLLAAALTLGGPGAVFWMWVSALLGIVKPCHIVYVPRPRVRKGLLLGEKAARVRMTYNYILGRWALGQKPFVTVEELEVLKMPDTPSIRPELLRQTHAHGGRELHYDLAVRVLDHVPHGLGLVFHRQSAGGANRRALAAANTVLRMIYAELSVHRNAEHLLSAKAHADPAALAPRLLHMKFECFLHAFQSFPHMIFK